MKTYPKEVLEIHNLFDIAGDNLLKQANAVLEQCNKNDILKGERLIKAGFTNARQVKESSIEAEKQAEAKKQSELVLYYKKNYPFNKFITKEQVIEICNKYNLVCAETSRYKGFVPDEKLKQIESFNIKSKDLDYNIATNFKEMYHHEKDKLKDIKECIILESRGENYYDFPKLNKTFLHSNNLYLNGNRYDYISLSSFDIVNNQKMVICAPEKDMDLKGLKKQGKFYFSFKKVEVPDPVVLQPVNGGYLVVTKWGTESSDPILMNPIEN